MGAILMRCGRASEQRFTADSDDVQCSLDAVVNPFRSQDITFFFFLINFIIADFEGNVNNSFHSLQVVTLKHLPKK